MLLRALGYSTNTDIFNAFGTTKILNPQKDDLNSSIGATITEDVVDLEQVRFSLREVQS